MWTTIRELVEQGSTILLPTQYLDEADQFADRIAVIDQGRKVAEGTPMSSSPPSVAPPSSSSWSRPTTSQRAASIAERLIGEAPVLTPEARRMNIGLQRSDQAVDILVGLREQQIHIDSVTVQKPSLDEVFLALTGHDTGESGADNSRPPTTRTTWRRSDEHH